MAHPAQKDAALQPTLAVLEWVCFACPQTHYWSQITFNILLSIHTRISVKYRGKACHASAYPWKGVNALDAAVLAYNNISVLRQQLRPDWRIHGQFKGKKIYWRRIKVQISHLNSPSHLDLLGRCVHLFALTRFHLHVHLCHLKTCKQ